MAETNEKMADSVLSGAGGGSDDPLGDNARARVKGKRQRKTTSFLGKDSSDNAESVQATQTAEQIARMQLVLAQLASPKSWERIFCAPFDCALMVTGAPEFNLAADVRQEFGVDGALIVQVFGAEIDPRILVLLKVAGDFTSVGANCWLAYKTRMLAESLARQEGLRVEK